MIIISSDVKAATVAFSHYLWERGHYHWWNLQSSHALHVELSEKKINEIPDFWSWQVAIFAQRFGWRITRIVKCPLLWNLFLCRYSCYTNDQRISTTRSSMLNLSWGPAHWLHLRSKDFDPGNGLAVLFLASWKHTKRIRKPIMNVDHFPEIMGFPYL